VRVDEHTITIDQVPVFYRSAGGGGATADETGANVDEPRTAPGEPPSAADRTDAPPNEPRAAPHDTGAEIVYHDAPGSSDDLLPLLERTGGLAPDLIGFGRSGKGGHLDYSPAGLVDFVETFLAEQGVGQMRFVGHGWGGAIGLLLAMRSPGRIERLVLIDAVPLLDGFSWDRHVRLWQRPLVGELMMGATPRWMAARHLRQGTVRNDAWSDARLAAAWQQFDQGTQRALLRLHRAAGESQLAALGAGLDKIYVPALVVWGERDPWCGVEFAEAYARRLPEASVVRVAEAGHWPWLDEPSTIVSVTEFVAAP
jgi:pimeloyl-ACP methyl ester carboxylesterase